MRRKIIVPLVAFCSLLSVDFVSAAEASGHSLGEELPIWSVIPFVGLLLSIAIFPLVKPKWWEHNLLYVALFWSLTFFIPFTIGFGAAESIKELIEIIALDYLPFIVLLWGLFAVSGGIVLKGDLAGSPKTNVVMLLIGTLLASWVGTTGASMLLIRPMLRANGWRAKKAHVVIFFIFLVSNIGGSLTPVGDPPLFLGFLRGIPFFWTMRLAPILLVNMVLLLSAFFIIDSRLYKKEAAAANKGGDGHIPVPLKVEGLHNLIFLALIVGSVILSGLISTAMGENAGIQIYPEVIMPYGSLAQMALVIVAGILSVKTTKKELHEANFFTWGPIKEVASLFIGIFITMIPALAILNVKGAELGLSQPWHFFWVTGALSSFLDNAPTYLVFFTTAGSLGATEGLATTVGTIAPQILLAVSAGAVFMGANTYIGNAPNFMVRSIAEENGVKMPSFFKYMGWSLCFLIPVFFIDMLIFFR
ncbi:MAG: sodium:proton antiporter [Clostridiales Family XIII bacterium]|nr:sodium:proton antiporter [Clostridiales Family XIII bacterium]